MEKYDEDESVHAKFPTQEVHQPPRTLPANPPLPNIIHGKKPDPLLDAKTTRQLNTQLPDEDDESDVHAHFHGLEKNTPHTLFSTAAAPSALKNNWDRTVNIEAHGRHGRLLPPPPRPDLLHTSPENREDKKNLSINFKTAKATRPPARRPYKRLPNVIITRNTPQNKKS